VWSFKFLNPITPISTRYVTPGGFQQAHTLDVDQVLIEMAEEVFRSRISKLGRSMPHWMSMANHSQQWH